MKKLFILALVGGIAFSASAQRTADRRPVPHRDHPGNYSQVKRENFQRRIDGINRDYDAQIRYVKNNPHLRNKDKKKQIRQLEKDRKLAITRLHDRYRNYRDGYSFRK